ncbi:hypothetical protein OJF2_36390 [Aquisphaera giovannonii]|uniref:TIGR03067 domain-containing protein n=1 Tax=Aquisphaera giovannonii TaxID=406548 RepID=A0A5B9W4A7_9BACT|nr:TIGR03067 domain-containing protein [Aquisphaera giovannonii]QEH35094.1 hypothetical protein OJF2_36390 [Aquisphaera giovannonii]
MLRLLLAVAAAVASAAAMAGGPEMDDAKAMEGTWGFVSGEVGGVKLPDEVLKTMSLVLEDGKYTTKSPGPDDKGTVKIDPGKEPKAMDITGVEGPNKGRTFPAIYVLDGDTLKICYDLSGKARPTEFKSPPGTKHFLAVYRRKK